jgi:thymidylate synthase (FAD)
MLVYLISYTPNPEYACGCAAAICAGSSYISRSLEHAIASGHTSVLEHAVFTFEVKGLSRAALAQLTRHRLASYDVKSQRYVRIGREDLVIPKTLEGEFADRVNKAMETVMDLYQEMVDAGIPKEDARYITPQGVTTDLIVTMNARELLHFFELRCCNRAQWEIRELADEMMEICKVMAPALFENAGPGCVTGRCPEMKPCGHPRDKSDWDWKEEDYCGDGDDHL